MKYGVAVISKGRPENVAKMAPFLRGQPVLWLVPEDEVSEYRNAGAVADSDGGSLCVARNMALDRTFAKDLVCVQVSDDLRGIKALDGDPVHPFAWALHEMEMALDETGLVLAGCAPTDNLYFAKPGVSTRKFIVGDLIMVRPTHLRFDENLRLKEDYDFTLQHWETYGGAARCDFIAPSFTHKTNAGGAVDVRTAEVEKESIAYLKEKWGDLIRDNPRRPNEVLLATRGRTR